MPIGGQLAWPDFARLASRTGFRGVDVMLQPAMAGGVEGTRRLLETSNLRPAYVNLPVEFRKDEAEFKKTLAQLEDAPPFAAAIGCPRMMTWLLSSSDTPADELRRTYKKRFTECANILARSHCRLGLEFLGPLHIRKRSPHEFIWKMNDMLAFAKECGPNVGLTLDAWHWHHAGATAQDIEAAGKERIVVVHFDDAAALAPEDVRDNQRLLPSEGVINLNAFLRALKKIGYEDGLSIEVFGRGLKEMHPDDSAKLCLEYGRKALLKAGIEES
ncbi:MAG: sugar phosphate isomerase/epimerase family protein [Bryobacteraceae bacterium]